MTPRVYMAPKCAMCSRKLKDEDRRVYSTFTRRYYCLPGRKCDESPANKRRLKALEK